MLSTNIVGNRAAMVTDGAVAETDGELVARARSGDQDAFDRLFHRHYSHIANFARRLSGGPDEAEDIAQTAFVRAYASLNRIRDGQALLAWLYRTVVNLVRDRAKSATRKPTVSVTDLGPAGEEALGALPDSGGKQRDPEAAALAEESERWLESALAELPLEFREAIVLHHLRGMDVREIAAIVGVPTGTVKSRLSRGRARLREALSGLYEEEEETE